MILEVDSSLNSTLQVPICATPLVVGKPNGLAALEAWLQHATYSSLFDMAIMARFVT